MSFVDLRVFGAAPVGLRRERIEASPRYRDGRFHNTAPTVPALRGEPLRKQLALFSELFLGGDKRTPGGVVPVESPHEAWARHPETGLRVTWLGHSTALLEIDGFRILTDPVWGERIGPFSFAGPKRFHAAPTTIEGLPPLDAILVSHDHYDHLDYPTIRALARSRAPFYTSSKPGGCRRHTSSSSIGGKRRPSCRAEAPRSRSPPRRAAISRAARAAAGATARCGRRG